MEQKRQDSECKNLSTYAKKLHIQAMNSVHRELKIPNVT